MIWKFTRGTLKAHLVLDESEGTTLCGRKGLKFDEIIDDSLYRKFKCKTCLKGLKKQEPMIDPLSPLGVDSFYSEYCREFSGPGADR
jgi:hypothetical protein